MPGGSDPPVPVPQKRPKLARKSTLKCEARKKSSNYICRVFNYLHDITVLHVLTKIEARFMLISGWLQPTWTKERDYDDNDDVDGW